jgi:IS5 family transposase
MLLEQMLRIHFMQQWFNLSGSAMEGALENDVTARDPEMKQGKKQGKKNSHEWRFGMKAHVGTDPNRLVHTLVSPRRPNPGPG